MYLRAELTWLFILGAQSPSSTPLPFSVTNYLNGHLSLLIVHFLDYISMRKIWNVEWRIRSKIDNREIFKIWKQYFQVVGNADAFKDDDVCNGGDATNGEAVVDEEGTFELSYYLDIKGDNPLPSDALVSDVVTYKASLTTYPILHIVE